MPTFTFRCDCGARFETFQRSWRDAHAGSVHAANDTERWLAMYGKGAFGLAIEDAMI